MTLDEFRDLIDCDDRNIIVKTDNAEDCAFVTEKYIEEFDVNPGTLADFCRNVISLNVPDGDKGYLNVASKKKEINFFSIHSIFTYDNYFVISFDEFMEMFSGQLFIPSLEEFV